MTKIDSNPQGGPCSPPQLQIFRDSGFSEQAAQAIADIDHTMMRIRRGMQKRELVTEILKQIAPELELSHLDAISAVGNWKYEPTDDNNEVTVGLVAERLNLDPSRASRLISELVELGYVRRVASQLDARRICIALTEKGGTFADEFRHRKWVHLSRGLEGWTEAELVTFRELLGRFSEWSKRGLEPMAAKVAAE